MIHTQGCVSETPTAEENPPAYVSITPSCMKNGKQCESIQLNLPPTQSLSAWFPDTLLVGNWGAGVKGPKPWYSRDFRVQDRLNCCSGVKEILTFSDLFTHKLLYHDRCGWPSSLLGILGSKMSLINKGLFYKTTHTHTDKQWDM